MKLQKGFMQNQEIADWFGITLKTLTNTKKAYMEKLKPFADFKIVRGGVIIEEIHREVYSKNLVDEAALYFEEVKKAENNIASVRGVTDALQLMSEFKDIPYETLRKRMTRAGEEAFGVTADPESRGIYGSREYMWAIKLYDRPNHYRELTEEEDALFEKLIENMYNIDARKIKVSMLLDEEFFNTEMTKEEYKEHRERINYMGINFFNDVIKEFKTQTGMQLVKATKHEIDYEYKDSAF